MSAQQRQQFVPNVLSLVSVEEDADPVTGLRVKNNRKQFLPFGKETVFMAHVAGKTASRSVFYLFATAV